METLRPGAPLVLVLAASLVSGLLAGCGAVADRVGEAVAEKALESAMDAQIDIDEGEEEVTITGDDGSLTMGTKLPAEWPSSIPLPTDHVVVSAATLDGTDASMTVVLQVPERDFDDVVAELDGALAGSPWTAKDEPITTDFGEDAEIRMWARQFTGGGQDLHVQVQSMEGELSVLYGLQAADA